MWKHSKGLGDPRSSGSVLGSAGQGCKLLTWQGTPRLCELGRRREEKQCLREVSGAGSGMVGRRVRARVWDSSHLRLARVLEPQRQG